MEQELLNWISSDNGLVVHAAVFFLLLLGGLGFPMPEDIPLLLAGVAASKQIVSLHAIFITSYLGVLLADQGIFLIGYLFGQRILNVGTKSRFFPSVTPKKIEEIREGLRKQRLFYIFIGRHLFPVRSVTFVTAGALRIPYLEFLITDAFAALVSVTAVLGIGYFLGGQLTPEIVEHLVHQAHYYIVGIVIISLGGYLLKQALSRRKEEPATAQAKKSCLPLQEDSLDGPIFSQNAK